MNERIGERIEHSGYHVLDDGEVTSDHILYYVNDSHYYLKDWKPISKAVVYCAGGGFPAMPGHYQLPCSEGTFDIFGGLELGGCGRV
jgi:hypothetical protein